jgi:hypothetical protein
VRWEERQNHGGRDPRHPSEQPRGVHGIEEEGERVEQDERHVVPVHRVQPASRSWKIRLVIAAMSPVRTG